MTTFWRGRLVQSIPAPVKWLFPVVVLGAAAVTAYFYSKRFRPISQSGSGPMPPPIIPLKGSKPTFCPLSLDQFASYGICKEQCVQKVNAKELIQQLNHLDPTPSTHPELFYPYDDKRDRYEKVLQPKNSMVQVQGKDDNLIPYNGARFVTERGKVYILMQEPLQASLESTRLMTYQCHVSLMIYLGGAWDPEHPSKECFHVKTWKKEELHAQETGVLASYWRPNKISVDQNWPNDITKIQCHQWVLEERGPGGTISQFIRFIKYCESHQIKEKTTAVYCNSGLGRTGVFMVSVLMLEAIEEGKTTLNPVELIRWLRSVRPGMVQTAEQLQFCFDVASYLLSDQYAKDFPSS